MTTRNDVDVEWNASPRVAEVAAPSEEINMQDIVDTLRKQEDTFRGMSERKLINAAGKEDLGGGVKVGITVALQNLLLAFAGRTTPAESGTVTSVPVAPVAGTQKFIDTAALFQTNNVQRGSLVINFADKSVADVISVDSETELTTKTLVEGDTNTYQVGDDYKVWNIVQVNAQGGNLVAVDDLQATISPILPTAFTQVILTSSSSATLQEQVDIQFASFGGGVTVNVTGSNPNAQSGTGYPVGTPRVPVDNMTDALAIANTRGLTRFYVQDDLTVPTGPDFTNKIFVGESPGRTTITIPAAATVEDCEYNDATITGTLDGNSTIRNCAVGTLAFVNGLIVESSLKAITITLGGGALAEFVDCWDEGPGFTKPTIDMGGSGQDLNVVRFAGGINITNKTGAGDSAVIDITSGEVVLDATVTAGDVIARGTGTLVDNSVGATVTNAIVDAQQIILLRKMMQNRMETDPTTGVLTIYDDDDTTVLLSGNIYEDVLASQIYRGRGMERRNRLT